MNGHRPIGVGQVQFILYLVAFAMALAAIYSAHVWWEEHNDAMIEQGRSEERIKWQAQRAKDQAGFEAEKAELLRKGNLALANAQSALAKAQADRDKQREEAERAKAENDRVARGLADGSIVLTIPARPGTSGNASGDGRAGPGPATVGAGDGGAPKPSQLPGYVSGFLFSEAARADTVVEELEADLQLARDSVLAYYLLAKDCREGKPR